MKPNEPNSEPEAERSAPDSPSSVPNASDEDAKPELGQPTRDISREGVMLRPSDGASIVAALTANPTSQKTRWTDRVTALSSFAVAVIAGIALYAAWNTYRLEANPVLFIECHPVTFDQANQETGAKKPLYSDIMVQPWPGTLESIAIARRFGTRYVQFPKTVTFGGQKLVDRCVLTNYGRSPAFNVNVSFTVRYRPDKKTPDDQAMTEPAGDYPGKDQDAIGLAATNGSFTFYLVNNSAMYAKIIPGANADVEIGGETQQTELHGSALAGQSELPPFVDAAR